MLCNFFMHYRSLFWSLSSLICLFQISKLSMIPVVCVMEWILHNKHYSKEVKIAVVVVVIGVGVCTVTDVKVNLKGFLCACIAVLSTSLQQIVSTSPIYLLLIFFLLQFGLYSLYFIYMWINWFVFLLFPSRSKMWLVFFLFPFCLSFWKKQNRKSRNVKLQLFIWNVNL